MNKNKIIRFLVYIVVLILIVFTAFLFYTSDYYRDAAGLNSYSNKFHNIEEENEFLCIKGNGDVKDTAIIFYPGGKVESCTYIPMLEMLAEEGYTSYIAEMPFNLAVFGENKAETIIQNHSEIDKFIIVGHSLGGVMAANFARDHLDEIDELVLLASYSTADLSNSELHTVLIYGDDDKILNASEYEKDKINLPRNYEEYVIEGNHSGFGNYGLQDGDGEMVIGQKEKTVDLILASINN